MVEINENYGYRRLIIWDSEKELICESCGFDDLTVIIRQVEAEDHNLEIILPRYLDNSDKLYKIADEIGKILNVKGDRLFYSLAENPIFDNNIIGLGVNNKYLKHIFDDDNRVIILEDIFEVCFKGYYEKW